MKTLNKKIIALIVIMIVLLSGITISNAADITTTLNSSDKLIAGETITVSINVAQPVYGISATLNYDKDVFESATVSSSVANSADLSNNVIVIESGSEMQAGTIGIITLKVKNTISKNQTTISFSNGKGTDINITTQRLNSPSITLFTDAEPEYGSVTDQDPTPEPEPQKPANNTNTPVETIQPQKNDIKGNTKVITASKSDKKILKAGDGTTIILAVAGIAVLVIAIVGFVKYAKNRDIK